MSEEPKQLDLEDDLLGGRANPPAPSFPTAQKPRKRTRKSGFEEQWNRKTR